MFEANIKVGQNLKGNSYPFINQETEKYFLQNAKGTFPLKQRDGDFPAIKQTVQDPGLQTIIYQSKKEFLEYDDIEKFNFFVKEYQLHVPKKITTKPKELYQRFAKTLFMKKDGIYQIPKPSLDFEIIPLSNPFKDKALKIKIYLRHKIFSNKTVLVFLENKNNIEKKVHQTNERGEVTIDTISPGFYLISAVHLENSSLIDQFKSKADFDSLWASLSFLKK